MRGKKEHMANTTKDKAHAQVKLNLSMFEDKAAKRQPEDPYKYGL